MTSRRTAYVRGAVVTAVVWGAVSGVAWLMLRELSRRGDIALADDVQALQIGVFSFVLFLASVLGAMVAGQRSDTDADEPALTFMLALGAPLMLFLVTLGVWDRFDAWDRSLSLSLLAAAVAGGSAGAVVAVFRSRSEVETFYERARREANRPSAGWRTN